MINHGHSLAIKHLPSMRRISESNIARKNTNEYHDISSCFEQLPFHVTSVGTHRRVSGFISPHPPSQGPCELEQKNDVDDCDESENLI